MQFKKLPLFILFISLLTIFTTMLIVDNKVLCSVYVLVIATVSIFWISYSGNKITSPASLLIISSFVFLGSRPFLSFLANYDFRIADWFIVGYMDDYVAYANYAISLMYFGYAIAIIASRNTLSPNQKVRQSTYIAPSLKFLFFLLLLGTIGMVLKGIYFFYYIESNSYVDIYQNNIKVPAGYDFLSYLFYCSFFLICAFYKEFRTKKLFLAIAIIIAAFSALKGSRSEFITFLLTISCIYYNEKSVSNIKLLAKMLALFVIVFALSEFVSMWRSGGSFIALLEGNNPIIDFLYGMGVSYIAVYQSVKLHMVNGITDASFLVGQIMITAASVLRIEVYLPEVSYSHLASFTANSELYSQGYGLGGSYLSESLLAMGLFGCFIIPCIILTLLNSMEKYTKYNPLFYFIYFSILPPFLFIPRETLLYSLPYLIKSIIVSFIVIIYSNYKSGAVRYDGKKC
ncbi:MULTISPECIES: O-antigen polysaccharide polymerase Wzy [Citrobacter]|uniref:O-antigen polysaccharide polymerase Wzy n=2 Tax=Citrobacter portucalensis TaxID=1639133 RepID=A0ABZ0H4G4_9ENTR|nr:MULTISPECIES: O-antigen polysaccharide polymerase Wzy [Citrobacter]MBJ8835981.1 O-antigen polysaccharide polymerase Wzy [Citrobacter freundii]MBJ9335306.1 O-antigen polysaccharide polymerase Wzy [Citrobacter freundii]MDE9572527.1 O-antigen polysaccharide polymerase Wzy family protein [Citrobacter portucalensis]MDE9648654.1 O-antigen polysaccharide polymerase Wzy family protein [Citrobacter portucalensis]MDE9662371.1 O-antigen polysaccharide polymerase Wzy family protein [Citrobacter portuca